MKLDQAIRGMHKASQANPSIVVNLRFGGDKRIQIEMQNIADNSTIFEERVKLSDLAGVLCRLALDINARKTGADAATKPRDPSGQ